MPIAKRNIFIVVSVACALALVFVMPTPINIAKGLSYQHEGIESEIVESISLNKAKIWKPFADKAISEHDNGKLGALVDNCIEFENVECLQYLIDNGANPCQINYPSFEVSTAQPSRTIDFLAKVMKEKGCF